MDINDFPAYGICLAAQSKDIMLIHFVGEETYSYRSKHGKKNSFTSHGLFLPSNHHF